MCAILTQTTEVVFGQGVISQQWKPQLRHAYCSHAYETTLMASGSIHYDHILTSTKPNAK